MKEGQGFNDNGKRAFEDIKDTCSYVDPDFSKDFILYCYASNHTLSTILLQKNDQDIEALISFMSVPLKKHELDNSLLDK